MKSLRKALDLLEYIASQDGRAVTPSELAENCKVNTTSCVRMVKTLTDRGYLTQLSRRDGYVGGPMLVAAGTHANRYLPLVDAARVPIDRLSRKLNCLLNLSILHNDRRYLLYVCGQTPGAHTLPVFAMPWDFSEYATERLLLAAQDEKTRKRIIDRYGLPPEFASFAELSKELDRYRHETTVTFFSRQFEYWIVGALLDMPDVPAAAIAFNVKLESDLPRAIEDARQCISEIRRNLTPQQTTFC